MQPSSTKTDVSVFAHPSILTAIAACCDEITLSQLAKTARIGRDVVEQTRTTRCAAALLHMGPSSPAKPMPPTPQLLEQACVRNNLHETVRTLSQALAAIEKDSQFTGTAWQSRVDPLWLQLAKLTVCQPMQANQPSLPGYVRQSDSIQSSYVGPTLDDGGKQPLACGFGYHRTCSNQPISKRVCVLQEEVGYYHWDKLHGLGLKWNFGDKKIWVGNFVHGTYQEQACPFPRQPKSLLQYNAIAYLLKLRLEEKS